MECWQESMAYSVFYVTKYLVYKPSLKFVYYVTAPELQPTSIWTENYRVYFAV